MVPLEGDLVDVAFQVVFAYRVMRTSGVSKYRRLALCSKSIIPGGGRN